MGNDVFYVQESAYEVNGFLGGVHAYRLTVNKDSRNSSGCLFKWM